MYGWERLVLLRHLLDEGLKKTDIAARLGVSRGAIYHWLRTGQLDRELDALPPTRTRVAGPSKLAPYEPIIEARLATYPELSAVRLFEEVRGASFACQARVGRSDSFDLVTTEPAIRRLCRLLLSLIGSRSGTSH